MGLRSRVVAGVAVALALTSCTSDATTGHGDVPPALAAELADQLEAEFEELAGTDGLAPSPPETRIQGLSVEGGTVASVLDVSRTIDGDEGEVKVVGVDVRAMVVEPGADHTYCVWLAATSTGLSSGIAVDGRQVDSGCAIRSGGSGLADVLRERHRDAVTLMYQGLDDQDQAQSEWPTWWAAQGAGRGAPAWG